MEANVIARRKSNTGESEGYGTVSEIVVRKYTFHLDTELGPPENYRELSTILMNAGPDDEVNLFLNGPGGYLSTCAQLVNLIQNSDALVTAHLMGPIASAHTFIFLACNSWVVYPHSSLMMHSYSGGVYEKGKEIIKSALATQSFFEELVQEVYYPFLTEAEVDMIIDGKDIHMQAKEVSKRLTPLVAYRASLAGAAMEEPEVIN